MPYLVDIPGRPALILKGNRRRVDLWKRSDGENHREERREGKLQPESYMREDLINE